MLKNDSLDIERKFSRSHVVSLFAVTYLANEADSDSDSEFHACSTVIGAHSEVKGSINK